jgi:hypothetical protein
MQLPGCVVSFKMESKQLNADAAQERLGKIIRRMKKIQKAIKASGQPPSMLELSELKELGNEYARIVDFLANHPGETGLA